MSEERAADDSSVGLSIGALSRACGVPVNTIRTWERRYGWPIPERTSGGQRVYASETVQAVRLVVRALDAGHRPGQVVGAPIARLRDLLGESVRAPVATDRISEWLDAARRLDGDALEAGLRAELSRLGAMRFAEERLLPFLRAMGDAWSRGQLEVFQEHYASERIRDLLGRTVRDLADLARGAVVVFATLPGERHALSLQIGALIAALNGLRPVFLGPDTPVGDVAGAAAQSRAIAVVISVTAAGADNAMNDVAALRAALHPDTELVVGGVAAPDVPGVTRFADFGAYADWASRRAS